MMFFGVFYGWEEVSCHIRSIKDQIGQHISKVQRSKMLERKIVIITLSIS